LANEKELLNKGKNMVKKISALAMVLLVLSAAALFSQDTKTVKSTVPAQKSVYADLNEVLKQGKPVVCLFYTAKACHCINKSCSDTRTALSPWVAKLDSSIVYCEFEVADHNALAQKYKIIAPPSLLIFDKSGKQKARLEAWQIKGEEINKKLIECGFITKAEADVRQSAE
jgi:hypothetical protein